jgi:hypothetical protein
MTENTNTETPLFIDETSVQQHAVTDLKHSILIVSVLVNLFLFIGWIALQVTSRYDAQLAEFLFVR